MSCAAISGAALYFLTNMTVFLHGLLQDSLGYALFPADIAERVAGKAGGLSIPVHEVVALANLP